jgi:hypothetical protein
MKSEFDEPCNAQLRAEKGIIVIIGIAVMFIIIYIQNLI